MTQSDDIVEEVTTVENAPPTQVVRKTIHTNPSVQEEPVQKVLDREKTIVRFNQVVWYVAGILEALLGFRVLLKALGANPFNGFTSFIYAVSNPFALPFQGIFGISVSGGYVIEWSTLFGMAIYGLLAYGLVELVQFMKPVTKDDVKRLAL